MNIKYLITSILALISPFVGASAHTTNAEVKVNVGAACIAIVNPSFEIGFAPHSSLSVDYVGAFAVDNWMGSGYPFILSMGVVGYRYYFDYDALKGFYAGAEVGANIFRMNKSCAFFTSDSRVNRYDVGYGHVMGVILGHKWSLGRRFTLDLNASFGWQHSEHEVYNLDGIRVTEFNASGEWLPYKAGLHIGYRLWR